MNIYYIYRYFLFKQISNFLEHSLEVFFFNSYGILRTRKLAAEKKYSVRKKKMERMERPVIISRKYFKDAISDIFLNIRLDLYYCIA